jgi:hypothetical protein
MKPEHRLKRGRYRTPWEQRLRDMLVACGAVALTSCATHTTGEKGNASTGPFDATTGSCNANPDPCCVPNSSACIALNEAKRACEADGGTWDTATGGRCVHCSGNTDPCCAGPSLDCAVWTAAKDRCEADGGAWDGFKCALRDTKDASRDNGKDAAPDARGGGQCNANPDPCCMDPSTPACRVKRACEADGGTWNDFASNPSMACTLLDAGSRPRPTDAGSDGHD